MTRDTIIQGLQETASNALLFTPQQLFVSKTKHRFDVYVSEDTLIIESGHVVFQGYIPDLVMMIVNYSAYNVFHLTVVYKTSVGITLHTTIKMQLDKRLRLDKSCKSIY